jgi:hypothetical protein
VTGTEVLLADETHVSAEVDLRGTWAHQGEPTLLGSPSRRYGEQGSYDGLS